MASSEAFTTCNYDEDSKMTVDETIAFHKLS